MKSQLNPDIEHEPARSGTDGKDTNEYWIERARPVMPGRQSNARALNEASLFMAEGSKQSLQDVSGRDYLDFAIAMGPGIWGNKHREYLAPIHEQLDRLLYVQSGALQTPHEVLLAEKIVEHVPSAENVRFLLAGSEAVQMAIRLARAQTSRNQILRFSGHYHGWLDNILGGSLNPDLGAEPFPIDDPNHAFFTHGRADTAMNECYMAPWNDFERFKEIIETYGDRIAMVMLEVINSNGGGCPPKPGFLELVRDLCTKHGIVLAFDEVITGFRVGLGGAQAEVGVTPDLTIFGKAIAGGIPLAAVAGKREIFDQIRNKRVVGAATFNAFPVGMVAALSTISLLEKNQGEVYKVRNAVQAHIEEEMKKSAAKHGHALITQGLKGAFCSHFTEEDVLWNYEDVASKSDGQKAVRFRHLLREEGIIQGLGNRFLVSFALNEADAEEAARRIDRALARLS